jgi:hypothetical protein
MATPGAFTFYAAHALRNDAFYGGKSTVLTEWTTNVETILASEVAVTWAATDTVRLESVDDVHTVYRNGASLISDPSDTAHPTGNVGMYVYVNNPGGNVFDATVETWNGGDVAAGPPPPSVSSAKAFRSIGWR